jgi:hypothetical protein
MDVRVKSGAFRVIGKNHSRMEERPDESQDLPIGMGVASQMVTRRDFRHARTILWTLAKLIVMVHKQKNRVWTVAAGRRLGPIETYKSVFCLMEAIRVLTFASETTASTVPDDQGFPKCRAVVARF